MKKFLTAVVLSSSLINDGAIAQGSKLDLSALKCRELFEMQREQIKIVMAWLHAMTCIPASRAACSLEYRCEDRSTRWEPR